jgi:two-component system KDP operon response regulator KdpE
MTTRRKLLVMDDDPAIFRHLRRDLMREGYDVVAASGQGIIARLDEWQPDIVLLDLAPPRVRLQIQTIRARSAAPLIELLSSEDTRTMIAALDAGVHDCVRKPFSLVELDAHIRKVLRRDMWYRGETPEYKSSTLRIDLVFRRVYRGVRTVSLSRRQFQLLKLLLDANGRVLTHRELMGAFWGHAERASVASLRRMIQGLRCQIEPDPSQPVHIRSQSRIGYRGARSHNGR